MNAILNFESRVYTAQQTSTLGGPLDQDGALGGPQQLMDSTPGQPGSSRPPVWNEFAAWEEPADELPEREKAYRASVVRGARLFREKTFLITASSEPHRSSCTFCHSMSPLGNGVASAQLDIGTTTEPFADPRPHLPLFKIRCLDNPHPIYGQTMLTHDPGYALTTGRCADVGKFTLQSLRGLAARAPYFANGTAQTLRALVDYYDRRYQIGYSEQEKQDLVALLSAL